MSLDKLQQAWEAESSHLNATFDPNRLSKEVDHSHKSFQSTIFWRDVREVGTSLVMVPIWLVLGSMLSLPWTWYLTVPAMLWIAGFMLVDRKRHPQHASVPGEPVLIGASKSLAQVDHQIWLLRNVFWWYLLPPSLSIMAFFVQIAWTTSDGWLEFAAFAGFLGLFLFLLYGWVYRVNQSAVRDQLEPRRNDLRKLISYLEDESGAMDPGDLVSLSSSLTGTEQNAGLSPNWATWSENWNRIIPSWREVAIILVPTLAGAFCGFRFPISDMGPVFFQSVVAAVIPFEIAFFSLGYLSSRRHREQPLTGKGTTRPGAPAIVTIAMIVVISALAIAALYSFVSQRGRELDDISEFTRGDITHIDGWLQRLNDLFYPSLSAVIVRDGEIAYQDSFGFENLETRKAATSTTPYHVASVTKVFTATLAAMLHEQGVVDLDQPAVMYLPENVPISTSPELGATITLRQLASHTSGLPRGVPGQVQSVEGRYELEPQRLYDHLESVKLVSSPGTTREYSNLGFGLLGHVLERASGKTLDRLMNEMICEPLQLSSTAIEDDANIQPATGYRRQSRGGAATTHSLKERLAGSGGLVTSTEDLAKFLIAQMEPGVFSSDVLDQLHTETRLSDDSGAGGALGWRIRWLEEVGPILEKNGGRSNCSAWIGFSPEHQVAVAIVTNCGGPNVDVLGRMLLAQSIPMSEKKIASGKVASGNVIAKASPFTDVRFEGEQVIVTYDAQRYEWLEVDEIKIDDIISHSKRRFGSKWQMRIAEDMVEVLQSMDHQPGETVKLRLRDLNLDQDVVVEAAPMTEQNRAEVYRRRTQSVL